MIHAANSFDCYALVHIYFQTKTNESEEKNEGNGVVSNGHTVTAGGGDKKTN